MLLVLAVLLPAAVKMGHVFENHVHEVCLNKSTAHFHTLDLECEFYKFKLSNHFFPIPDNFDVLETLENHAISTSQYVFLSAFQQLPFSLRGPPENS
ncbi:hypothetical protein ES674_11455 [Bizionia myxarmorum]|uniref:Uncharacterized protein n=1 Tax=Bizionia myxarmorum TaxID=291186 RepID=A0A5D0R6C2_9FLAO|nr:hypothetical protein ES674_11455 [Bizionia myxarmorum]